MIELDEFKFDISENSIKKLKKILDYLGNPQKKIPSVTIAGTVGKGQTALHIFQGTEGRIGIYTSPHLIKENERIRDKKGFIEDDELKRLKEEVIKVARRLDTSLTYFEVMTISAFLWFSQRCDFAIYEVGLGGRLDAVRLAESPYVVFTRIHYDHTDILGNDIKKIAFEKFSVAKQNSLKITIKNEEIKELIKEFGIEEIDFEVIEIDDKDFFDRCIIKFDGGEIDYFGPIETAENAALAGVMINKIFSKKTFFFNAKDHKGRFELKKKNGKKIIYDGAHNPISAKILSNFLKRKLNKKLPFVVAFMNEKDWKKIIQILTPITKEFIITTSNTPRSATPEEIAKEVIIPHKTFPTPNQALDYALQKYDEIVITGTLYIYKYFYEI